MYFNGRLRSLRSLVGTRIAVELLAGLVVCLQRRFYHRQLILAGLGIAKDDGRLFGFGQCIDRLGDCAWIEHDLWAIGVIKKGCVRRRIAPGRRLSVLAIGIIMAAAISCAIVPKVDIARAVVADASLSLCSAASKVVVIISVVESAVLYEGGGYGEDE